MSPRAPTYATAEAVLFGAVASAGLYYVISTLNVEVRAAAGDVLVAGWLLVVAVGVAALGAVRGHSTGSLLSGALGGVVIGFAAFALLVGWGLVAFALLVGWGLVAFALPLFSALAVVAGAWANYERRRRRGTATEPARGTWRSRLAGVAVASLLGVGLLIAI